MAPRTVSMSMSQPIRKPTLSTPSAKLIAIGASTGGPDAVKYVLREIPEDSPGIIIVQHMPEVFTKVFARHLNDLCRLKVKEAETGDPVLPGTALICPGNRHIQVARRDDQFRVDVTQGPLIHHRRPSVDLLFSSVAKAAGPNALGVILTGMGDDGAVGLLEMKEAGAMTIAQNQETAAIFGMPQKAIASGGVDEVAPLQLIPKIILSWIQNRI